jgi:hypothetical protein
LAFESFEVKSKRVTKTVWWPLRMASWQRAVAICVLADSGTADEHQVGRFLEELGLEEFHDLIAGDFGVEGPVEIGQEFHPADTGHLHRVFDFSLFPGFGLILKESFEESSFFFREVL